MSDRKAGGESLAMREAGAARQEIANRLGLDKGPIRN